MPFHFRGHILAPLIVWLVKRGDSPEIDAHGKEALNFQISMLIYNAVSLVFCLVLIGFVALGILWILNAIFVIIASIQASEGKFYRYPMTIRFIQQSKERSLSRLLDFHVSAGLQSSAPKLNGSEALRQRLHGLAATRPRSTPRRGTAQFCRSRSSSVTLPRWDSRTRPFMTSP